MTAVESRLAATLAKHYDVTPTGVSWPHWRCRCGHTLTHNGFAPEAEHARHVAERIAAADDLAVIELDTPDVDEDGLAAFSDGSAVGSVVADAGTVYGAGWEWTPEGAVDVGRQWVAAGRWAAAKAAEAVSDR